MIVLPVLDLLDGHVVHGKAGRRTEYRPIVSKLTTSSDPLDVAKAIHDHFGLSTFYLADLDGIARRRVHLPQYQRLTNAGFSLIVDAGIVDPLGAMFCREAGVTRLIVGLESCRSPGMLDAMVSVENDQIPEITFSVDLVNGELKLNQQATDWSASPREVIVQVVDRGVKSIVVLDLADVGMGTGGSTDTLCRFVRDHFSEVHLIAGGGVRSQEDLLRYEQVGVAEVLVASALHDGRLSREDIAAFGP